MPNQLKLAEEFATSKHFGQKRKYYDADYIVHPKRVAMIVRTINMPETVIQAAWLHDTIEDTDTSYEDLHLIFGKQVSDLVKELTNPSKQHPELNRAARKKMDREHISECSREAKIIKLADRIDNVESLMKPATPLDFVWLYLHETVQLSEVLRGTHSLLCDLLDDTVAHVNVWANGQVKLRQEN